MFKTNKALNCWNYWSLWNHWNAITSGNFFDRIAVFKHAHDELVEPFEVSTGLRFA
jgi:hypothetical protein